MFRARGAEVEWSEWGHTERMRVEGDPLEVLRWATKNGAEAMGRADELGTIEVGKLADFAVVDRDPLAIDPDELDEIRVLETWIGGRRRTPAQPARILPPSRQE